MKITTLRLFQVLVFVSVLILITISKASNKNKRNKKYSGKRNRVSSQPKEDPILIAKGKCKEFCNKELEEAKKKPIQDQTKIPVDNSFNVYHKKAEEDIEYYLCECLLSNDSQIVQKEFSYANKSNIQAWFKNDDDGKKVYKKSLKKGLTKEGNEKYKLIQ